MEDLQFSDAFCQFIKTALPSVDAAELLLLLHDDPTRRWGPADIPAALRPNSNMAVDECERLLALFYACGLIAVGEDQRVRYQARDEDIAGHVDRLARAYRERPVTLIRLIMRRGQRLGSPVR